MFCQKSSETLKSILHDVPRRAGIVLACLFWVVVDRLGGFGSFYFAPRFSTYGQIIKHNTAQVPQVISFHRIL